MHDEVVEFNVESIKPCTLSPPATTYFKEGTRNAELIVTVYGILSIAITESENEDTFYSNR